MNQPDIYEGVPPWATRPEADEPPREPRAKRRLWLHALLFTLTCVSAMWARIVDLAFEDGFDDALLGPIAHPEFLADGLVFASTLMVILLAHEMGHYLTARRYGVDQSLPYFIPAPTLFGTLGAVILMRSQPLNKSVLLRVAVMGPFAGMVLAIPLAFWGIANSVPAGDGALDTSGYTFGSSVLWSFIVSLVGPDAPAIEPHPVALGAWVGFFVTSLNLIPAAQLDGGHVSYALFGRAHERISRLVVAGLFITGVVLGVREEGILWIVWGILLFVLGLRHPPVQQEDAPLTRGERLAGFAALVLFLLTFVPTPITPRETEPVWKRPYPRHELPNRREAPERTFDGKRAEEFRL